MSQLANRRIPDYIEAAHRRACENGQQELSHWLREALVVEVTSSAMVAKTAGVMRMTLSARSIGVVELLGWMRGRRPSSRLRPLGRCGRTGCAHSTPEH